MGDLGDAVLQTQGMHLDLDLRVLSQVFQDPLAALSHEELVGRAFLRF